jgi:hypothetical protein
MLHILSVPSGFPRFILYLLDNTLTNPAKVWLHAGAPVFPEQQLRAQIRATEVSYKDKNMFCKTFVGTNKNFAFEILVMH